MAHDNKIVWSEGMFLRPQQFQQNDRYTDWLVRTRVAGLTPYAWGVTNLDINRELLLSGKFAVTSCRGVLEDGTPFAIPEQADHPVPLAPAENVRNAIVYLAVPVRQPGGVETLPMGRDDAAARFAASEFSVFDSVAGFDGQANIQIGRLRFRYLLETEERAGYSCLGLARIVEVRPDRSIVLDERYIPPALACAASQPLQSFIAEIQGLLQQRGQAVAARVVDPSASGVAEFADFLLLMAVNRYEPLFTHYLTLAELHPERFYASAVQLAGELDTFMSRSKRATSFPPYRHTDLQATFAAVMGDIRQSLSAVLERTAVPIPLQERRHGIRVAPITDRTLIASATLVLAVKADMQTEPLRRNFPMQVKIGPAEQIAKLVNVALPGIPVRALPVAPRQIPYVAGMVYFELERNVPLWRDLQTSGGLAIHVAGDFPGLVMELWAIRSG
jgi:type VI secretion system protein ImpJ